MGEIKKKTESGQINQILKQYMISSWIYFYFILLQSMKYDFHAKEYIYSKHIFVKDDNEIILLQTARASKLLFP